MQRYCEINVAVQDDKQRSVKGRSCGGALGKEIIGGLEVITQSYFDEDEKKKRDIIE